MSEVRTIQNQAVRYKLTVADGYICFRGENGYENTVTKLDTLKQVNITPDASTKKIYASGKVYDVTQNVRGAKLAIDAIALPEDFLTKARGSYVNGGVSYEMSLPLTKEFGFGFVTKHSDGKDIYVWCPRCKLTFANEENVTSDESDIDPKESYEIEAMPTDEGIWRLKYDTKEVEGTALTADEFYKNAPYTTAEIEAI